MLIGLLCVATESYYLHCSANDRRLQQGYGCVLVSYVLIRNLCNMRYARIYDTQQLIIKTTFIMTKEQKMELRNKLRAKFLERIAQRISREVENEGLRIMSEKLSVYTKEQNDPVLAFIRFGEDWSYAKCDSGIITLRGIYEDFGITNDMMSLRHFVMQYNFMYAAEAVRTINEWRERNGVGVETAY